MLAQVDLLSIVYGEKKCTLASLSSSVCHCYIDKKICLSFYVPNWYEASRVMVITFFRAFTLRQAYLASLLFRAPLISYTMNCSHMEKMSNIGHLQVTQVITVFQN